MAIMIRYYDASTSISIGAHEIQIERPGHIISPGCKHSTTTHCDILMCKYCVLHGSLLT